MKIKLYLALLGAIAFSVIAKGQSTANVILSSQSDVNSYQANYGLTVIPGQLNISGDDITDLTPLSGITTIGTLYITGNGNLESLHGLETVTSIGNACPCIDKGLIINTNPKLVDIDGLSGVTSVAAMVNVSNNASLKSIDGLSQLTSVGSNLEFGDQSIVIDSNPKLTSLSAFSNISARIGGVYITNNDALADLRGFQNITTIGGYGMQITGNDALTNISALSRISSIANVLKISDNVLLPNLNGLQSFGSISIVRGSGVSLIISNNPSLENVDSLSNFVELIGPKETLTVTNNPKLTKGCGLYPVLTALASCTSCTQAIDFTGSGVTREQILAGGPCTLSGPGVCSGDVALTSQADVNAFATNHSCTIISGMLTINGNDITDLTPLSNIDSVGSLFIINNANLASLHGLEGIKVIGHTCACISPGLVVDNNAKLSDINGLSGLTSNAGLIKITNNAILRNVDGLSHLIRLGDGIDYAVQSIVIGNNPMLASLAGFSNLSGVVGGVDINNNNALINLNGLQHITSIAGYGLSITNNVELSDISALSKVTDVGAGIHISNNLRLPNVNGLRSLQRINIVRGGGVAIVVSDNPALGNVDSLSNLTEMRGPTMTVDFSNNASLVRGCGLFPLLNDYVQNCSDCQVNYNFSGSTVITREQILAGGPCPAESASCNSNISLASQADVDSFPSKYGCTVIHGSLFIRGADITNLDSLVHIRSVDMLFIDGNPLLENVDGLNHLTTVAGMLTGTPLAGLRINDNSKLTNLNGLSSLTSVGQELVITNNPSLRNIEGLASLTSVGANPQIHYLGLDLENNAALTTIAGLRNLSGIAGYVDIINNDALVDFDGLQKIQQINVSGLAIMNNDALKNVNGLSSLRRIYGTYSSGLRISNNASLTNVDSLSNLVDMGNPPRYLTVTDNPNLTRGCGLYNIIRIQFCEGCNGTLTLTNNGAGFTRDEIIAGGPCNGNDTVSPTRPTNLIFTDITDNSMTVSFSAGVRADGYLVLMRAFESSLPDERPVNNIFYEVGDVIGCCSIVVGKGMDTTHYIVYLEPDVDYYFDIIPWIRVDIGITYFPDLALSGHQRTLPQAQPYPNPFVEELIIPVTVTDDNSTVNILITDQLGRPVSRIVQTLGSAGKYEIKWNRIDSSGNRVMNGVYTYSIITPNNSIKGLVMAK